MCAFATNIIDEQMDIAIVWDKDIMGYRVSVVCDIVRKFILLPESYCHIRHTLTHSLPINYLQCRGHRNALTSVTYLQWLVEWIVRSYSEMYECVYDRLMNECNGTSRGVTVYVIYHVNRWQPLLSTVNCTASECNNSVKAYSHRQHYWSVEVYSAALRKQVSKKCWIT